MELKYQKKATIRSSAVLTGSYVAATVVGPEGLAPDIDPVNNNQLGLLVNFTIGDLTSAELKVEFSDDGSTYYQETASSVSGDTSTETLVEHSFASTGNYRLLIPIVDRYIKVSVKGTGTVTSSLMDLEAIIGVRP